MSNYQRYVDEIQAFLEGVDQKRSTELDEIATGYSEACRQANARLRRCGDYLRRGLRTEAIHLAEQAPELLDMVAALDIRKIDAWEETCSLYDLPKPQRLLIDVAAELNDAYAAEQPLSVALANQRLLALARAPLSERIAVLQQLVALDPATLHWVQDATEMEQAYFSDLNQTVANLVRDEDIPAAVALMDQLQARQWVSAPPVALTKALIALEVRGLMREVVESCDQQDAERLRQALHDVRHVTEQRRVGLGEAHQGQYARARAWLAQHDKDRQLQEAFEGICASLMHEIQTRARTEYIVALYGKACTFGRPLPDEVRAAHEKLTTERTQRQQRARRRNLVLAAVVLICAAAGIAYYARESAKNRAAERWASSIAANIEQVQLDEARAAWEEMLAHDPTLGDRPPIPRLRQQLDEAITREEERLAAFVALMRDAGTQQDGVARAKHLSQAARLARTNQEKLQVHEARRRNLVDQPQTSSVSSRNPGHP